jgi:7,8-dihydropterin-6-yl-methyl-4-(beta-D-ribofuranosyl)aminobenzene 5'-phosphate synthase
MITHLSMTILIDDVVCQTGLLAEHGFSLWIEADDYRILFDTGQSSALIDNARLLNIDLRSADAVVLSHGHYDHTGGLRETLEKIPEALVYCHPGAAVPRYSKNSGGASKAIHMPSSSAAALLAPGIKVFWVTAPVSIQKHIGLTGPVPRLTGENTGGNFFLDPEMRKADLIEDDLSLWMETPRGLVILCGCCHSGIINTVRHIQKLRPGMKIRAIIGGLHLLNASKERLEKSIEELSALRPERIVACHCTGETAMEAMRMRWGESFSRGAAGMKIEFPGDIPLQPVNR